MVCGPYRAPGGPSFHPPAGYRAAGIWARGDTHYRADSTYYAGPFLRVLIARAGPRCLLRKQSILSDTPPSPIVAFMATRHNQGLFAERRPCITRSQNWRKVSRGGAAPIRRRSNSAYSLRRESRILPLFEGGRIPQYIRRRLGVVGGNS